MAPVTQHTRVRTLRSILVLRAAGYEPFVAPRDTGWGIRMAGFSDPDGHPVYLQHDL